MGGGIGGPMRAAAKVAALGGGLAKSSAFRGGAAQPAAEHSSALCNKGSMPVSTLSSSSAVRESSSVDKSSWEIVDEWEFAEEIPRVVFGGTPSYHEAEEATIELKEAIEQVYLSSENSPTHEDCSTVPQGAGLASLTKAACLETKSCISANPIAAPSIPNHALQAFKFLSETPAAQTVIASVASDQNVWNAVLQNPALVDFMHSCKNSDSAAGNVDGKSVTVVQELPNLSQPRNPLNDLMDVLQNIKLTVLQMVSRVSDFLQDIFGSFVAEKPSDVDGHWQPTCTEKTIGASVMGLAVLAIMVVVLKRN